MEDMYGLYSGGGGGDYYLYGGGSVEDRPLMSPEGLFPPPPPAAPEYGQPGFLRGGFGAYDVFGSDELASAISEAGSINIYDHQLHREGGASAAEGTVKSKIKAHPSYPRLLQAYIDCQKVGAPPEIASVLEEIRKETDLACMRSSDNLVPSYSTGSDPELDEFMETYIDMLVKYKSDLERPFDEAATFLNKIEMQLSDLSTASLSDEGFGSSDEEFSRGEVEASLEAQSKTEDRGLKDRLLRKFGSHISLLKLEFSKKKKKGKLPKEARQTLLEWWNAHYKWPYPTESDKTILADSTGLDQKQINNWFINQRKRHWKPSENMQFGLDNLPGQFYPED